ncbi:ATP-binding cassette domain-containing protein, partial [Acinetobacter baumannii]
MSILLDVKGVTKRFGGITANNDITFDVNEGEILGIIGPNGAGKTTLLKAISRSIGSQGTLKFKD